MNLEKQKHFQTPTLFGQVVTCVYLFVYRTLPIREEQHELTPTVGQKPLLPSYRCTAISFIRIFLQESALHRRSYRLPTNTGYSYDCGRIVDDQEHFFLHCSQYAKARQELILKVTESGMIVNNQKNSRYLCCWLQLPTVISQDQNVGQSYTVPLSTRSDRDVFYNYIGLVLSHCGSSLSEEKCFSDFMCTTSCMAKRICLICDQLMTRHCVVTVSQELTTGGRYSVHIDVKDSTTTLINQC